MTLVPLDIPAGFYRNGTDYEQSNRWRDGSLVRWRDNSLRPIGGWQERKTSFCTNPIRGMHTWEALNATAWVAGGSHDQLTVMTGAGTLYDITPHDLATGREDAAVGSGYGSGFFGVGYYGTPIQQLSGSVPEEATTWSLDNFGENLLGVHYDDGRLLEWALDTTVGAETISTGDFAADSNWTKGTGWAIASGVASWTGTTATNLEQTVASLVDDKTYEVLITLIDPDADGDPATVPSAKIKVTGTTTTTVLLDETLAVGANRFRFKTDDTSVDIDIYAATNAEPAFDIDDVSMKLRPIAETVANAPTDNLGMVVTEERFVFCLGAGGNSRKVQWSDFQDVTTWTAATTNQAGSQELQTQGQIMQGIRTRGQTLIITDTDAHTARYLGPPYVYTFERVGTSCGAVSRKSAADVDMGVFWMGQKGFFRFDGNAVAEIPCDVHDYVFGDINTAQQSKIWAVANGQYGEIWWFYCSENSTEVNRYVAFDYKENHWLIGDLARTSGVQRGVFRYMFMAGHADDSDIYEHEVGLNYDDKLVFAETGPVALGTGDQIMKVNKVIPDEATQGQINLKFKSRLYPNVSRKLTKSSVDTFNAGSVVTDFGNANDEIEHGPFDPANETNVRFSGRQIRMRVETDTNEDGDKLYSNWRVGTMRLEAMPGGRR